MGDTLKPGQGVGREARKRQGIAMLAGGTPVVEVARQLGVKRDSVQRWQRMHEDEIRQMAEQRAKSIAERLEQLNTKAVSALDKLLASKNEKVRLAAARTVLSRTGYPEGREVDMHVTGLEGKSDEDVARELVRMGKQLMSEGDGDG